MPESFYDQMVIVYFTLVPALFLSFQVFLSTRRRLLWGAIVPLIWSALGAWILIKGYLEDKQLSYELLIVFLVGDFFLLGLLVLCRYLKSRGLKKQSTHQTKKK